MKQYCSIYLTSSGFHVVAQAITEYGIGISCDPMYLVGVADGDELLGNKVSLAMQAFRRDVPNPNPDADAEFSKRMLSFLKAKSWKAVGRQAKLLHVLVQDNSTTIIPARTSEDGSFENIEASTVTIDRPTHGDLGSEIRRVFASI